MGVWSLGEFNCMDTIRLDVNITSKVTRPYLVQPCIYPYLLPFVLVSNSHDVFWGSHLHLVETLSSGPPGKCATPFAEVFNAAQCAVLNCTSEWKVMF